MIQNPAIPTSARGGVPRAVAVVTAWALVQTVVLLGPPPVLVLLPLLVVLSVGLFITAHDAMHGSVAPDHPRLNDAIGRLAAGLYAGFSFAHLKARHLRHHRDPTGPDDPDHPRVPGGPVGWYLAFMVEYATGAQLLRAAAAWWVLAAFLPEPRVLIGWVVPALLASVQLFAFGIYRVHHDPPGGWGADPYRARSERFPRWLSWLTCWHFGHHREHHRHPHLPWWALPDAPRA